MVGDLGQYKCEHLLMAQRGLRENAKVIFQIDKESRTDSRSSRQLIAPVRHVRSKRRVPHDKTFSRLGTDIQCLQVFWWRNNVAVWFRIRPLDKLDASKEQYAARLMRERVFFCSMKSRVPIRTGFRMISGYK